MIILIEKQTTVPVAHKAKKQTVLTRVMKMENPAVLSESIAVENHTSVPVAHKIKK
ncbi:hypothetical protein ACNFJN_15780 [Xenorhabdus budapestensis]|uniref:hypothetical protein n=1 Tax=Xenorhabdus budapestensis TaxID=290110 RepID=UPI003A87F5EB